MLHCARVRLTPSRTRRVGATALPCLAALTRHGLLLNASAAVPYSDMAIHRIVRRAGAYWIETTVTSGAVLPHAESYSSKRAAMEHIRTLRATPEVIAETVLVDRRIGNRRIADRRTQVRPR
jgi:hypothetical protein